MMNHPTQESSACSVLSERHALCAGYEMRGGGNADAPSAIGDSQQLALNTRRRVIAGCLNRTIGRRNRLNISFLYRSKKLHSDTHQEQ